MEFTFVQTEDGSPTLRLSLAAGEPQGEAMHSLKGAFSETAYIYGKVIETALERGFQPEILSLGLGLGYVEILAAGLFLKHGVDPERAGGESFESVPELRDWFVAWARDGYQQPPQEFRDAYYSILKRTSQETGVPSDEIGEFLKQMLDSERWRVRDAMTAATMFDRRFGAICFDAFSSKTSPELWTEEFLGSFFARATAPGCALATYACTGALKRSLRAAGFTLDIREGFASKRDSTFAVREPGAGKPAV